MNVLKMKKILVLVIVSIVMAVSQVVLACPGCTEEIAKPETAGLADGLSYTVVGMVSMPFLLFAVVGGIVFQAYRKRNRSSADVDIDHINWN